MFKIFVLQADGLLACGRIVNEAFDLRGGVRAELFGQVAEQRCNSQFSIATSSLSTR
ncbi:hypothetical protein SH449x_001661 [Pirellulaceae bacterium SH449]